MRNVAVEPRRERAASRLWSRLKAAAPSWPLRAAGQVSDLPLSVLRNQEEFLRHRRAFKHLYERRLRLLDRMGRAPHPIQTRARCVACRRITDMRTDPEAQGLEPGETPNWREGLICSRCGLNSRTRAAVHLALWLGLTSRSARIYLTEQVSALYQWARRRYPRATGSEYLRDGTQPGGRNRAGVRCEDLTNLSFAAESFDAIFSLDVIEHIPDFQRAFAECARVLAPGGKLVLSVPFHRGPNHLLRAQVRPDGSIDHLVPPEYHGDPLDHQGCLCFHHFGWDILGFLKSAGFHRAEAVSIWSPEFGYLAADGDLLMFVAVK